MKVCCLTTQTFTHPKIKLNKNHPNPNQNNPYSNRLRWTAELPITTNAYYTNEENKISFPAGVLDWPFYEPRAPRAVNYGAVGMIVGHEITHGFDQTGRNYDINGEVRIPTFSFEINWNELKIVGEGLFFIDKKRGVQI